MNRNATPHKALMLQPLIQLDAEKMVESEELNRAIPRNENWLPSPPSPVAAVGDGNSRFSTGRLCERSEAQEAEPWCYEKIGDRS